MTVFRPLVGGDNRAAVGNDLYPAIRVDNVASSNVLLSSYTTLETRLAPVWDTPIPDQSTVVSILPATYNAAQHVSSNAGQDVTYSISPAVAGITVNPSTGRITCAIGTAVGNHSVTVMATNSTGPASDTFIWSVVAAGEQDNIMWYYHAHRTRAVAAR